MLFEGARIVVKPSFLNQVCSQLRIVPHDQLHRIAHELAENYRVNYYTLIAF
jgi:hypothetical protein